MTLAEQENHAWATRDDEEWLALLEGAEEDARSYEEMVAYEEHEAFLREQEENS